MQYPDGVVSGFVNVAGVKTHYLAAGDGEPVVLIHGSGPGASGWSGWRQAIPALARRFRVYALDTIGYGLTDKPTTIVYSDQACTNHLAGFIDALCLDTALLCGNSRGAYMAAKYMLDHPHRVRRLLMVSSGSIANAMGIERDATQMAGMEANEAYDGTPAGMRRFMEVIVADHAKITDELIRQRVAYAAMPGHDHARRSQREYRRRLKTDPNERQLFDIRHRLPMVTIPMYMVWGAKDRFAPPAFADRLKALLPNVTFEMFEDSGHQAQNDECDRFNATAIRFLGGEI